MNEKSKPAASGVISLIFNAYHPASAWRLGAKAPGSNPGTPTKLCEKQKTTDRTSDQSTLDLTTESKVDMSKMIIALAAILILSACAPSAEAAQEASAQTQAANPTAASTSGPPSRTPRPTYTPSQVPTNTPLPEPIILTGSGDSIVDFEKWVGPAIIKVKHTGDNNFMVKNYAANSSDYINLMVNTIGSYEGTLPLDFYIDEHTARFEITAGGAWEIQIHPFETIATKDVPTTVKGAGDDIFGIISGTPDLLKVDASQADSNFIISAIKADESTDVVVNEVAPYTGTATLDPTVIIFIINAKGPWSLEITAK